MTNSGSSATTQQQRGLNYPPLSHGTAQARQAFLNEVRHMVSHVGREPVTASTVATLVGSNIPRVARLLNWAVDQGMLQVEVEHQTHCRQRKWYFASGQQV